jgi:hypothetical protein
MDKMSIMSFYVFFFCSPSPPFEFELGGGDPKGTLTPRTGRCRWLEAPFYGFV